MADITAAMVKDLREKTGVGMMDCKAALAATSGDMEAAIDWLRAKGLAKAAKKSTRVAAEGLVAVAVEGNTGAVVEVNSETDFVARNEKFQAMVAEISKLALKANGDTEILKTMHVPGSQHAVAEYVAEMVAAIGENMTVRRTAALTVKDGVVGSYVHNQIAPGMGKIGVIVALESAGDPQQLMGFGRQVAMHIAAANPQAVDVESLDKAVIARERAVLTEQAKESGKPDPVIEKMVEGRLRKFYEEVVLLKQAFVLNPDVTVEKALKDAEKEIGAPARISAYLRFALGEGIEKETTDFAAEVAAAVKK